MFCFFGHEAYVILAPGSGIEPPPPVLEAKALTTGPPGKSWDFFKEHVMYLSYKMRGNQYSSFLEQCLLSAVCQALLPEIQW